MARVRTGRVTFHGSFTSQLAARKKEAKTPGSFIIKRGDRYYVLKEKKVESNNRKRTRSRNSNPNRRLIYEKITRVEGTKGKESQFAGQRFFHNFKKPYPRMFGLPNGDLLITSRSHK